MGYKTDLVPALQALIDAKTANKNAIAAKGVTVPDNAKFADFPALIAQISGSGGGGVELPVATTVTADKLFKGVTAYTQAGVMVTGTALSESASAGLGDVLEGKTFYDHTGTLKTGTRPAGVNLGEVTTATADDIAEGKTAYNNNGTLLTGTKDMATFGWTADRSTWNGNGKQFCFTGLNPLSFDGGYFEASIDCGECVKANENILSIGKDITELEGIHIHIYYTKATKLLKVNLVSGQHYSCAELTMSNDVFTFKISADGIYIGGTNILTATNFTDSGVSYTDAFNGVKGLDVWNMGVQQGTVIGKAKYSGVKIYPEPFGCVYIDRGTMPVEPTSYNLIDTYSGTTTFTAPETGFYKIEVYGASGAGSAGIGFSRDEEDSDGEVNTYHYARGGNGGGGGAFCSSELVKLAKDDVIQITTDTSRKVSVSIGSSIDTSYSVMICTAGTDASRPTSSSHNSAGTGGKASGGSTSNLNGNNGSTGKFIAYAQSNTASGGAGGSAVIAGGNAGGNGASASYYNTPAGGAGTDGFVKIYRGNTNAAS